MEYRGKKIKGLEIYDSTNRNKVIVKICDNCIDAENGYKVRVIPYVEEIKTNN